MSANPLNLLSLYYENIGVFLLILMRIQAAFVVFIFFRRDYFNLRSMIALTSLLAATILLNKPASFPLTDFLSMKTLVIVGMQFSIGFMIGFVLNIIFELFSILGQMLSAQMGLSTASFYDPRFGNITDLTKFYTLTISVIFLCVNGHLQFIRIVFKSFDFIPVTMTHFNIQLLKQILNFSKILFTGSIVLSLSLFTSILITNITLSVLSKFAPQINIFSLGASLTIILGLIGIYLTYPTLISGSEYALNNGFNFVGELLIGMRNVR